MRAKIVEIGLKDGFYNRRTDFINKAGEWEPGSSMDNGWESGFMNFDDPIERWYFIQVKVELFEAEIDNTKEFIIDAGVTSLLEGFANKYIRHGHPDFYRLCEEEMELHSRKNHDYAAGGNPLGNFNRVSAILAMYPGLKPSDPAVVAITYLMKQLDASLWMLSNGHEARVEGHRERWQDISVYSKIISILISEKNPK